MNPVDEKRLEGTIPSLPPGAQSGLIGRRATLLGERLDLVLAQLQYRDTDHRGYVDRALVDQILEERAEVRRQERIATGARASLAERRTWSVPTPRRQAEERLHLGGAALGATLPFEEADTAQGEPLEIRLRGLGVLPRWLSTMNP